LLDAAAARYGRSLYILSDEPFARIVFDGRRSHSPAAFYPDTLIAYSYGKVLLTPGLRLGYLAVSPAMREREVVRESVVAIQAVLGGSSPSALLQHALPDLEQLSLSVDQLARRRDRMVAALRAAGYAVHTPEATFFLLARAPWEDDAAFAELLAAHDVLVLPGHVVEMPGYLRISLTASDETIERGLPGFASAWEHASAHPFPDVASGGGRA
jgi:aspartate aminotransferase